MKKIWCSLIVLSLASGSVNAMESVSDDDTKIDGSLLDALENVKGVDITETVHMLNTAQEQDDDGDAGSEEVQATGLKLTKKRTEKRQKIATSQRVLEKRAQHIEKLSSALDEEEEALTNLLESKELTENDVQDLSKRLEKISDLAKFTDESDSSVQDSMFSEVDVEWDKEDQEVHKMLESDLRDRSEKLTVMQEGMTQNVEGCQERIERLRKMLEKLEEKDTSEKEALGKAQSDYKLIAERLLTHGTVYKGKEAVTNELMEDLEEEKREEERKKELPPVVVVVDNDGQQKNGFCTVL